MIQTMEAIRSKSHLFCLSSNKHLSSIFMRENLSFDWARRWRGEKTCGRSNFSMQNSFTQILLLTFIIFIAIFHTLVVEANNNNKKLPPRSFTQMSNMLFANEFFFRMIVSLLSIWVLVDFTHFHLFPTTQWGEAAQSNFEFANEKHAQPFHCDGFSIFDIN